ncbi:MAG: hypothetical protein AAF423_03065 [Pseudomonadota bacterium]
MEFYLTPLTATILLIFAVSFGHMFRQNWKDQKKNWKMRAWIYGCLAAIAFLVLAFTPLKF